MKDKKKYTPIGSDAISIYGFRFGMFRYQVEFFDHNKNKKIAKKDDTNTRVLKGLSYWDTICGTRIYRLCDRDFGYTADSAIYLYKYINEKKLKKMILDDVIDWKQEDPYEFKERFETGRFSRIFDQLFPGEREDVILPYPECKSPYNRCPVCGKKLNEDDIETENAVDIFNNHVKADYWGEPTGWWHEVHRCPRCEHLFFITEEL